MRARDGLRRGRVDSLVIGHRLIYALALFIAADLISGGAFARERSMPPVETAAYFAPAIVGHTPSEREATPGNQIKSEDVCRRLGGKWLRDPDDKCVLPLSNAGKSCHNSSECIGHCLWPLNGNSIDGRPMRKGYGLCQWDDYPDDCGRPHFENGKIIFFNCD